MSHVVLRQKLASLDQFEFSKPLNRVKVGSIPEMIHFLTSYRHLRYVAHKRHIAHFFKNHIKLCAYNVPVVCTYFFDKSILKYNIIAFQRHVALVFKTNIRFCGSNSDLMPLIPTQLSSIPKMWFSFDRMFAKIFE